MDLRRSLPPVLLCHLAHDARRIEVERPRDREEFDDVDAALPAFVFRDEALGFAQPVGKLLLGQSRFFAGGRQ